MTLYVHSPPIPPKVCEQKEKTQGPIKWGRALLGVRSLRSGFVYSSGGMVLVDRGSWGISYLQSPNLSSSKCAAPRTDNILILAGGNLTTTTTLTGVSTNSRQAARLRKVVTQSAYRRTYEEVYRAVQKEPCAATLTKHPSETNKEP